MKVFALEEGHIVLDRAEIALEKEFNNLLRRDNPCEEDKNSIKKIMAFKEFRYIYELCDYNSYCNQSGKSDKEAHEYAIKEACLPDNWKPDSEVKAAMIKYRKLNTSVSRELYVELSAAFHNSSRVIKKLNEEINKVLEKEDISPTDVAILVDNQQKLLNMATALPKQIETLSKAEDLVKMSEGAKVVRRGGGEVEDSMNPEESL
jgi:hypothetical protein